MLGFWTLTLSRPQSAAVTPSGNPTSRLPTRPGLLPLACCIASVIGLLLSVSVRECLPIREFSAGTCPFPRTLGTRAISEGTREPAPRPDTFFAYSVYTPKDPVAVARVFS